MLDADEAKDLIDESVERAEAAEQSARSAEREQERAFRNRVSILVGIFAVLLSIVHMMAESNGRESVLKTISASDTYTYMQAKIIRESVLTSAAAAPSLGSKARATMLAEAQRLRADDRAGHGISQLQEAGARLREEGEIASARGERFEMAETALQLAIVLLSIALVAQSLPLVIGASTLAALGVATGLLAFLVGR